MLFGTRHADATEHQDGLVLAVAVESVVKLAAFLAVGLLVTFFLFGSARATSSTMLAASRQVQAALDYRTSLGTWLVMTGLSGFAIIMLPRQFYVMIVENRNESELRTATWVFPLYLVLINLFVLPIALRRCWHWSATAPARTSMSCRCRCLPATICWPWRRLSAACRRRPRWSSSPASRCRS